MVGLGYGITRPFIKDKLPKILLLSFLYLVSFIIETVVDHLEVNFRIMRLARLFGSLPVLVINIIFFIWIVIAFRKTILVLTQKRQELKLAIYKKLLVVLAVALFIMFICQVF